MKTVVDQPGYLALQDYQRHAGGMALFQAYLERRSADKQATEIRREALVRETENGTDPARFWEISRELLMLQILSELDPVIAGLITFCKNPGSGLDQLVNVRSALRIGKRHAPSDSAGTVRRWDAQARWIAAYLRMQDDNVFRSDNNIAEEVATAVGVSRATAINYWKALKDSSPQQARWALQIANSAKAVANRAKRETQPTKRETGKGKRRITFGKEGV